MTRVPCPDTERTLVTHDGVRQRATSDDPPEVIAPSPERVRGIATVETELIDTLLAAGRAEPAVGRPVRGPVRERVGNLRSVSPVAIGVVQEGFGREEGVDDAVGGALDALADAGATVEAVSIPGHLDGEVVFPGFAMQEVLR